MIALVRGYQKWISPLFPPSCIYRPTCSSYMIQAVEKHGALKGVLMGCGRICRCHPFIRGGQDPVPDYFTLRRNKDYRKKIIDASKQDTADQRQLAVFSILLEERTIVSQVDVSTVRTIDKKELVNDIEKAEENTILFRIFFEQISFYMK